MKTIDVKEVEMHNKRDDCWVIANGNVYDIAKYIHRHPGGRFVIEQYAGKNVTRYFKNHSSHAKKLWEQYKIGAISKDNNCCFLWGFKHWLNY